MQDHVEQKLVRIPTQTNKYNWHQNAYLANTSMGSNKVVGIIL